MECKQIAFVYLFLVRISYDRQTRGNKQMYSVVQQLYSFPSFVVVSFFNYCNLPSFFFFSLLYFIIIFYFFTFS